MWDGRQDVLTWSQSSNGLIEVCNLQVDFLRRIIGVRCDGIHVHARPWSWLGDSRNRWENSQVWYCRRVVEQYARAAGKTLLCNLGFVPDYVIQLDCSSTQSEPARFSVEVGLTKRVTKEEELCSCCLVISFLFVTSPEFLFCLSKDLLCISAIDYTSKISCCYFFLLCQFLNTENGYLSFFRVVPTW